MQLSTCNSGYYQLKTEVLIMLPLKRLMARMLLCSAALGLPLAGQAATDDIEREFDVAPGGTLTLGSDAGEVDVNTWDQNRVRVLVRNPRGFAVSVEQIGRASCRERV